MESKYEYYELILCVTCNSHIHKNQINLIKREKKTICKICTQKPKDVLQFMRRTNL